MSYDLFIGDKSFSSWSLRGWLLLEKFDIPYTEHMLGLYSGTMTKDMASLAPARLVPTLRTPEGWVVGETSAIAETLAERHPDAGIWPKDGEARSYARWLAGEMHAGFGALRTDCGMQLIYVMKGFSPSDAVKADLARIDDLLGRAMGRFGADGPWLFGDYTAADAFYAPVAARIIGYDLPVSDRLRAYAMTHLNDTAFRKWRREGLKTTYTPMPYDLGLPTQPWPVAD
ncbi:glutathione S-transferase [Celeribacter marinus]|uniref:glutathione S-transferase n=1 Tax=Celeribacter marinus TaxID=1397108 RepID=UPI003F6D6EEC